MSTYKIKPLPDAWGKELKGLKMQFKDTKHLRRLLNYSAILHTCDVLVDSFNTKKVRYSKVKPLEMISYYYFSHCYHLSYSIYHLSKLGFGSACIILSRSIIESLINLAYLWLCKRINGSEQERVAWMKYEAITREKMDEMWKDMQQHRKDINLKAVDPYQLFNDKKSNELKLQSEDFVKEFGRRHWATIKTLDKRARAVDDTKVLSKVNGMVLEEIYNMCYRWSIELVHAESPSVASYLEDTDNKLFVDFGPSFKNVDMVVPMANRMMLGVLFMVNQINHLNVNIMKQLEESGLVLESE